MRVQNFFQKLGASRSLLTTWIRKCLLIGWEGWRHQTSEGERGSSPSARHSRLKASATRIRIGPALAADFTSFIMSVLYLTNLQSYTLTYSSYLLLNLLAYLTYSYTLLSTIPYSLPYLTPDHTLRPYIPNLLTTILTSHHGNRTHDHWIFSHAIFHWAILSCGLLISKGIL